MKTTILLGILCTQLVACKTPEQNARLAAVVDIALGVATRRGAISAADAEAVRQAGTVILTPAPTTELPHVDVTATK